MRFLLASAAVCSILLAGAAIAIAAYPQDSVTTYTGCLVTKGGLAGIITSVGVGSSPVAPCNPRSALLIHLSGGTITQVSAGTGLTGGGNNGAVTVGLDPKYQFPQTGCSSGQLVASNGSGGWSCQSATSYGNGTGLDLSGNTFSLKPGYQLPQSCSNGQVATSDGDGGWTSSASIGDNDTQAAVVFCNVGDFVTGGGGDVDGNAGLDATGPDSQNGGWYARATVPFDFGFGSGDVYASARCLHLG